MRLKDWAEQQGIHYQTAWKWFRDGKLPVPALQTPSGTILVQPDAMPPPGGGLGLYARVSSHDQRADLDRQVRRLTQWATTARAPVVRVEAEVADVAAAPLRRLSRALRDVRAGVHHGAYCLGCCWSLMALFVVLGVMNLAAMVVLAAVVLVEKLWGHGEVLSRAVGVSALAFAVAAIWLPALAPGLHGAGQMMGMAGS